MAQKTPNYFMYFPDNYRWSAEMLAILSTIPYGSADIAEADRCVRQLRAHVGDDEKWFEVWREGGDRLYKSARADEEKGRRLTAAGAFLRACAHYQHAEHFRQPKDEAALKVYRQSLDCFRRYAELIDRPRIELVELPFDGGAFPAIYVHAENTTAKRNPAVVRFPGFDTQKELQFLRGITDITRRGMSVLIVDGPGQGEALRLRGLGLHHEYEIAGSAAIDYLETRNDVDKDRIGIVALSLGGYFAPRCAAYDKRYQACVAWGAIWDYYATWERRIKALKEASLPVPADHLLWVTGTNTFEDALAKLEGFRLDGVAQKVECPFLLTHGTEDAQVPMADAQKLFDAIGSKDKTFRVFDAEEGGAQHCQRDYLTLVSTTIADWLAEKLQDGKRHGPETGPSGQASCGRSRRAGRSAASRSRTFRRSAKREYPADATANWWGVTVPRGTPPQIVRPLNQEINAVRVTPDVEKRLVSEGAASATKSPEAL